MTRPKIGSEYRPRRYEHRTATEFQSLRPEMSSDAIRLQRAFTSKPRPWLDATAWDRIIGAALVAAAVVAVYIELVAL